MLRRHAVWGSILTGIALEAAVFADDAPRLRPLPEPVRSFWRDRGAGSSASGSLVTVSWRSEGSAALLYRGAAEPPKNADLVGASLALAAALGPELGVDPSDLLLSGFTLLDGLETVTFSQRHRGIPVHDGALVFVYRDGVIAAVRNELVLGLAAAPAAPLLSAAEAALAAQKALALAGSGATLSRPSDAEAALVYLALGEAPDDLALAWKVQATEDSPRRSLELYLDSQTGALLGAEDRLKHFDGEGQIRFLVEPRTVGDARAPVTAVNLGLAGGEGTDADGETLRQGAVEATYDGPYARIIDQSGAPLERFSFTFAGAMRTYDISPQNLSQADPFVHINNIQQIARALTPSIGWLRTKLDVNVNLSDVCNAYWDGQSVNFFAAGGGCQNSGRIASIVYHEFGHGYHQALTSRLVGSVGEGTGDFLAASALDDPVIGRGFAPQGQGIRQLDQARRYPDDVRGEVHEDGLIWASALWELRDRLIAKHGPRDGRLLAQRIFVRALAQGPGLATAYPTVILGDDDDGQAMNGTPDACEINAVFAAHGLIDSRDFHHARAPEQAFARIEHASPGVVAPGEVVITARVSNASSCGSIDPSAARLHYAIGGGAFTTVAMSAAQGTVGATIPGVPPGALVRYFIDLPVGATLFSSGSSAAPHQLRAETPGAGSARLLLSEGFEAGLGAFSHGVMGAARTDDWEAGAPTGRAQDPEAAHAGTGVAGTDLGHGAGSGDTDGVAKPGRRSYLESPALDADLADLIRVEFWESLALVGARRVIVGGRTVLEESLPAPGVAFGWRFRSIEVPRAQLASPGELRVRFEVDVDAGNTLGGWSIDEVTVRAETLPVARADRPLAPLIPSVERQPVAAPGLVSARGVFVPIADDRDAPRAGAIAAGCSCLRALQAPPLALALLPLAALARALRRRPKKP